MHQSARCPSVQDFASDCRRVQCRKEAGGKRVGPAGKQIGHAHLTWAFAEAATWFWRNNPQAQQRLARVEKKPHKGKALSLLAHQLGRAVDFMRKRQGAFNLDLFLKTSGSSAGEPGASLDTPGDEPDASPLSVCCDCGVERHGVPRPCIPEPAALIGHPLWLLHRR